MKRLIPSVSVINSILHTTVITVAQTEQIAAAKEEENLMVPNEFPQDAAHAHLLLGGKFLACDDGILWDHFLDVLETHLYNLIAQVHKGDAYRLVAAFDNHENSRSQLFVIVKEMHRFGIVIHNYSFWMMAQR